VKEKNPLLIIVPCYKNPHLIAPLVEGIENCTKDILRSQITDHRMLGGVFLINDSPDDMSLGAELDKAKTTLSEKNINCIIHTNNKNMGFVKSVNIGLSEAIQQGCDALLLNSDAKLYTGCIEELRYVAEADPMVGFVSPRSNNAGICTIPHLTSSSQSPMWSEADAYASYLEASRWLPRWHLTPTVVGFCMYIKNIIISEFGVLDEAFGHGYNEENDLVMRANGYGYRAALANHAYCWHSGSESFGKSEFVKRDAENRLLLDAKHPEYTKIVNSYYGSPTFRSESVVSGIITGLPDGKRHIALDLANIGPHFNGTAEMAVQIARSIYKQNNPDGNTILHFITDQKTATFHGIADIGYIEQPNADRRYAAVVHMGQPFSWDGIRRAAYSAPINGFFMLDTIAQDCGYLHNDEVDDIWRFVAQHSDIIFYISNYSRTIFLNRFEIGQAVTEKVCLLSTNASDYAVINRRNHKHILIVGNHYRHKAVPETVEILSAAFPQKQIIVVGSQTDRFFQNVTFIKAGEIAHDVMEGYYADAEFVVFPSHYEGFGIPIVKSVAYNKVVYTRQSGLVDEIVRHITQPHLVKTYKNIMDLPAMIASANTNHPESGVGGKAITWDHVASEVTSIINETLNHPDGGYRLRRRLSALHAIDRNNDCEALRKEIISMSMSKSWRVTKPLRIATSSIRKAVSSLKRNTRT
jgi:GT2 family glycosyltransferase